MPADFSFAASTGLKKIEKQNRLKTRLKFSLNHRVSVMLALELCRRYLFDDHIQALVFCPEDRCPDNSGQCLNQQWCRWFHPVTHSVPGI